MAFKNKYLSKKSELDNLLLGIYKWRHTNSGSFWRPFPLRLVIRAILPIGLDLLVTNLSTPYPEKIITSFMNVLLLEVSDTER
jgi:hypothetical protein